MHSFLSFFMLMFCPQDADEFMARQKYLLERLQADTIVFKAPNMKSGDTQEDQLVKGFHFFYVFGFDLTGEGYAVIKRDGDKIFRQLYTDEDIPILMTRTQGFEIKKLSEFEENREKVLEGAVYWEHAAGKRGSISNTATQGKSSNIENLITAMRTIKSPAEIRLIQKATDIACEAHKNAMKNITKLKHEKEIESLIQNTYLALGAQDIAFSSICGSGVNGVTLHYQANSDPLPEDTLVVIDIGCKYNNYVTDVTRTVPTSGKFTGRMREAYEAVLGSQKAAEQRLRPGIRMAELQQVSVDYLKEKGFPPYPHGIGHYVGLATHDDGMYGPFKEGTVITIEPGYYSKKDGFGIRIEDMYLVTKDGFIRLTESAPREIDEIEKLIEQGSKTELKKEERVFNITDEEMNPRQRPRRIFGVTVDQQVTDEEVKSLSLGDGKGALKVLSAEPGSVAEKCGVQKGDYIIKFNGTDIPFDDSIIVFTGLIRSAPAKKDIELVVIRDGLKKVLIANFE